MARDVFISYQSDDKECADRVCEALERQNISCWIAPRDIPVGSEWAAAIVEGIQRCHFFVVILSSHSSSARQISRELSICGHVIGNGEALIVEDLSRDRRFANNPLIKEHGLRFYAGVPLRSNSLSIGSLCIFDTKARRMTDREKRLLGVMAEDVMEEIQRRDTAGSPGVLTIT